MRQTSMWLDLVCLCCDFSSIPFLTVDQKFDLLRVMYLVVAKKVEAEGPFALLFLELFNPKDDDDDAKRTP
jgi:hypothetical protein